MHQQSQDQTPNSQQVQVVSPQNKPSLKQKNQLLAQIKQKQKQVGQLFQHCKYSEAQNVLNNCISILEQKIQPIKQITQQNELLCTKTIDLLINRSSLYMAITEYQKAYDDTEKSNKIFKLPTHQNYTWKYPNTPRIMCTKINALLKLKRQKQARQYSLQCLKQYPYHKKLTELAKLSKQRMITENQQSFLDHMFQKLCCHPKVREYLKDEAFLTKVQRMIRNPSLTSALQQMDPRIKEASEALMMADENWS